MTMGCASRVETTGTLSSRPPLYSHVPVTGAASLTSHRISPSPSLQSHQERVEEKEEEEGEEEEEEEEEMHIIVAYI